VAWFRETIAAWNDGTRDIEWERIDPDFELHSAMVGILRGPEGLRRYFDEIDQQFADWDLTIDRDHDLGGDRFLLVGSVRLRGRGSGLEMDQELAWQIGFDGQSAVLMRTYTDVERAFEEAGLDPPGDGGAE
jgi:ketosteroid isomerase-like protein